MGSCSELTRNKKPNECVWEFGNGKCEKVQLVNGLPAMLLSIPPLLRLVMDYATAYVSVEYSISVESLQLGGLLSDPGMEFWEIEEYVGLPVLSKRVRKLWGAQIKPGDVVRWEGEEERNTGRLFWTEAGLRPLNSKFDDYGTVWEDMTANAVFSSTFYEDTVDGHGCYAIFDSCGYFVKDLLRIPSDDETYVCQHLVTLQHHERSYCQWFVLFNNEYVNLPLTVFANTPQEAYEDENQKKQRLGKRKHEEQGRITKRWYLSPSSSLDIFPVGDPFFTTHPYVPRSRLLIEDD